jgi:hypothetical protein
MKIHPLAYLGLLTLVSSISAQTEIYTPYKNTSLWNADTLYLGAGFTRLSNTPVKIWLKAEEAGLDGQLFIMDPNSGAEIALFANHSQVGVVLDLSSMINIPIGTTLTFMYKVVGKGKWNRDLFGDLMQPKFTGPNHRRAKYVTKVSSNNNQNPGLRYGKRWSVAGRVNSNLLEFGFEDDILDDSDMDFDDIVFQVEGLSLAIFENSAKQRYYVW